MAEKTKDESMESVVSANGHNPVVHVVRTVLLAGIGTLALGKEEIESIVHRLVERGEIAERDGRELVADLFDRGQKDVTEVSEKSDSIVTQRTEAILARIDVPRRSDLEELNRQIVELTERIEQLSQKVN
ncbi:MAG: phasin family protein [Caldilineales bacterium]|nr:phasin family protein [Caldilineales bacterium]